MHSFTTEYKAIKAKIKNAESLNQLDKIETSLNNLYNNGIFSVNQFSKLDKILIDTKIKIKAESINHHADHTEEMYKHINRFRNPYN